MKQKTLKNTLTFSGIGVHSGLSSTVILHPAEANFGIQIHDSQDKNKRLRIGNVIPLPALHATVIVHNGWKISTIEHVMAAIGMLGIDNVRIELQGDEFPIFDGSALPFAQEIVAAGSVEQEKDRLFLTPRERLEFEDDTGRSICIEPAQCLSDGSINKKLFVNYTAEFEHPLVAKSEFSGSVTTDWFLQEVAPARTFGFLFQLPFLRKNGLAKGTTLGNTVVIGEDDYINDPRFPDEFVRHKVLDLLGDLVLLGKPLAGTITAHKTGHSFNRVVVEHYVRCPEMWVEI